MFLVATPTVYHDNNAVDASHIQSAMQMIDAYTREGSTVIIESSLAVGQTRKYLSPIAARKRLFAGMSLEVRSHISLDQHNLK